MTAIDQTYQPRAWQCEECRAVLGYVLRDVNRVRRLWVLRRPQVPNMISAVAGVEPLPVSVIFYHAGLVRYSTSSLFQVRGMDSGEVGCPGCGSVQRWDPSLEAMEDMIRQSRGDAGVRRFREIMRIPQKSP
jgi:hypothetical protein